MSHLFVTTETGPPACIDSACLVPNRGLIAGSGAGLGGMRMTGDREWGAGTRLSLFGWVMDVLSDLPFRGG